MCVCVCVFVCVFEREKVYVCVSVRERERRYVCVIPPLQSSTRSRAAIIIVSWFVSERRCEYVSDRENTDVCVCVCERERGARRSSTG